MQSDSLLTCIQLCCMHTCVMGGCTCTNCYLYIYTIVTVIYICIAGQVHAWCLIQSPCCCCMKPIIIRIIMYVGLHALPSSWATTPHTLQKGPCVLLCPPAYKWSKHTWRWWQDRCMNVQLKSVPTCHALNAYIIYVTTLCAQVMYMHPGC